MQVRFELTLSPGQLSRLETYLDTLLKWQEKVNLICEPSLQRLLQFHFLESFWIAEHFLTNQTDLTDVGSGAGFPGLAAKIYRPGLTLTLIEKKARKALFLETVIRQLDFPNVSVYPLRWQEYQDWKPGGTVCIRALKPSQGLMERLRKHRQVLLLLHSSELSLEYRNYMIVKQLLVPGSRRRVATQLLLK